MQTTLYVLGIVATVAALLAGVLASLHDDHKLPSIWLLFLALVLYAFTLCLYLDDKHRTWMASQKPTEPTAHEVESPTPTPDASTPTPTPPPPSPQASDDYQPDETAISILAQIEKGVAWESELARALHLEPAQVSNSLKPLVKHDYVRLIRPEGRAPYYQITQKGVDRLDRPADTHLKKTSQSSRRDDFKPDELCVKIMKLIYHSPSLTSLMDFVAALEEDIILIAPRLDKLLTYKYVTRVNEQPMSPLERSPFILTPKGLKYLEETPDYKGILHPSGRLDEPSEKLLILLADPKGKTQPTPLGKALGIHPVKVHVLLTKLCERGYAAHNSYHRMTGEPGYCLTHPGREYLVNHNLLTDS